MTPDQKAKKSNELADAQLAEMDNQEAAQRASQQLKLDALNIRAAEGGALTPAEEAKREELAQALEDVGIDYADEQIRIRYGITGPVGPAVRAFDANLQGANSVLRLRMRHETREWPNTV